MEQDQFDAKALWEELEQAAAQGLRPPKLDLGRMSAALKYGREEMKKGVVDENEAKEGPKDGFEAMEMLFRKASSLDEKAALSAEIQESSTEGELPAENRAKRKHGGL